MMGSLDEEVTHLAFDHTGVAAISALKVDFVEHFTQKEQVVIFIVVEGGKDPVSRFWTG